MELNDVQRIRLQRIINIASNATWEGDISALGFALLRYSGLDIDNGYMISSENHIIDKRKADIIVEVTVNRIKVLVIECKKDVTHPSRSRDQLIGYMQDGGFPNGMLMYPLNTTFYSLDVTTEDAEVIKGPTYNNITDYEEVLQNMAIMRMHDLEQI